MIHDQQHHSGNSKPALLTLSDRVSRRCTRCDRLTLGHRLRLACKVSDAEM